MSRIVTECLFRLKLLSFSSAGLHVDLHVYLQVYILIVVQQLLLQASTLQPSFMHAVRVVLSSAAVDNYSLLQPLVTAHSRICCWSSRSPSFYGLLRYSWLSSVRSSAPPRYVSTGTCSLWLSTHVTVLLAFTPVAYSWTFETGLVGPHQLLWGPHQLLCVRCSVGECVGPIRQINTLLFI